MTYITENGMQTVQCTSCRLVTPPMAVASEAVAADVLRAAGWVMKEGTATCPRCRSRVLPPSLV